MWPLSRAESGQTHAEGLSWSRDRDTERLGPGPGVELSGPFPQEVSSAAALAQVHGRREEAGEETGRTAQQSAPVMPLGSRGSEALPLAPMESRLPQGHVRHLNPAL